LKQFRYKVVVAWCADERAFIARVPALPVFAARGHTAEEATEIARSAAQAILAVMREEGQSAPAPDFKPRTPGDRREQELLRETSRGPASARSQRAPSSATT
jgi:antitoxin HicB